jgi:hypothetical protein
MPAAMKPEPQICQGLCSLVVGGDIDRLLDQVPGVMSWQRKVIRDVLASPTPDHLFCFQPPRQQIRVGLTYQALMEHYAIEVMRGTG